MKYLHRFLVEGPHLALCLDEKAFVRECRRLKVPEHEIPEFSSSAATMHTFRKPGKLICIVTMRAERGVVIEQVYALLVHEAVHVWQAFRDHIGEKEPSSEFEASAIQGIAQRLMLAYKGSR